MSKLETNTIDTISGSTNLTLGGTNATDITIPSGVTVAGFKSTGIDDNATSTAITIDSSENVGINESAPLGKLHVKSADSGVTTPDAGADDLIIESSTDTGMSFLSTDTATIRFNDANGSGDASYQYRHDDRSTRIVSAGSERMRIDSSGRVGISNTSPNYTLEIGDTDTGKGWSINLNNNVGNVRSRSDLTDTQTHYNFVNPNGVVGTIKTVGSSTSYNTSSDHRLKENVSYDFDATTRLKQLKPARFNFIADANITVDGFIAHEVQDVVPEAITGIKDETETKEKVVVNANGNVIAENIEQADWEAGKIADENGNTQYPTDSTWEATKVVPVYQGIDQSKLVPLLVKTIQELEARIAALENA